MSENRTGESQWVLLHYTILRGRGRAINLSGIKVNFHIQAYVRQQQYELIQGAPRIPPARLVTWRSQVCLFRSLLSLCLFLLVV